MHVQYNPEDYGLWARYYGAQASQTGYGIEGFHGMPYQRGAGLGSFFRSIFRMAVPLMKSVGKQVGRHALAAGANVASDVVKGRPLFQSGKEHFEKEAVKMLDEASQALRAQSGEGLGIMPKPINTTNVDAFAKFKQKKINNGTRRRKVLAQY